jgi:hypothetical protein
MTKTNEEERVEREAMLHWAEIKLQDGENTTVSRHTRFSAIFDSIYARLLLQALRAGIPEADEHPSKHVILAGAKAVGLDDESLDEVLDLYSAVAGSRYKPWTHSANMLHTLALARHIAELAKR